MSGTDVDQLDADAILSALVRHDVDFVVIGGFAVAAHGYVRATKDVDVVPEPSAANLASLYEALREIGAEPMESGDLDPVELPVRFDAAGLGGGGNWALRTRHGRIDVMQWVPGLESYDALRAGCLQIELPGVGLVPFAGYHELVAMKRAAARPEDRLDLDRMRETRAP